MPKFIIGRDASCDIVINDPSVSRRHAELLIENNQAQVRDLGSSNGTMVNGVRIASPQMLNDYDILKVAGSLVPWKNYLDGNSSSAIYSESLVSSVGAQPQNYGYEENLLKQRLPNATLVLLLGLLSFYLPLIVFVGILMFLGLAAIIILVVPPILGLLISIATLVVASKIKKYSLRIHQDILDMHHLMLGLLLQ